MINDWQFPSGATQAGSYRGYKSGGDEPNSSSFEDQAGAEATLGGSSQRSRRVEVSGLDGRPTPGSAIHSARRKDGLDMDTLQGRIALVSGGSRGIGAAVSLALAEAGCDIALNFRSRISEAEEVATKIRAHGRRATTVQSDVSQAVQVHAMVQRVAKELGEVSILVNNAGISRPQKLEEITEADWDEIIDINLKSAFLMTQAVVPAMRRQRWGRIINISSVAAQTGGVVGPHYASSKAGMIGLTHSYAALLAKDGITANAVAPALVKTDMVLANPRATPDVIPVSHFGEVEDVSSVVVVLARNGYITGQTINVNGGWYMS